MLSAWRKSLSKRRPECNPRYAVESGMPFGL
jgi:hypothetical protein